MQPTVFPGQRYGHLVVERLIGRTPTKKRLWLCRCDCGLTTEVVSPHLRSGHTVSCGCRRTDVGKERRSPIERRFWSYVVKGDGCWAWSGSRNEDGYGILSRPGRHTGKVGAHRLSWEIHRGPVPDGLSVLHRCDNPQCTNPDHLFLGTQADNMQDCAAKKRLHIREQRGERNAFTKLTNEDARAIRDRYAAGALQGELADQWHVGRGTISEIVRGLSFVDAGGPITIRPKNEKLNARRWGTA
jgi:hypothetical protein